jgi:hypothetical protein
MKQPNNFNNIARHKKNKMMQKERKMRVEALEWCMHNAKTNVMST